MKVTECFHFCACNSKFHVRFFRTFYQRFQAFIPGFILYANRFLFLEFTTTCYYRLIFLGIYRFRGFIEKLQILIPFSYL